MENPRMESALHLENHAGVLHVRLLVASLGEPEIRAMYDAVGDAEQDDSVRAVVFHLRPVGPGVRASGRLADGVATLGPSQGMSVFTRLEKTLASLERMPKPTAAVFDGPIGTIGLELALVVDLKLATPDTVFYIQGPERGFLPGMSLHRLSRTVGLGLAKHLVLHRGRLGAMEATQHGVVDRLVSSPDRELRAEVARLLATPPATLNLARQMLHEAGPMGYQQAYDAYKAAQFHALHKLQAGEPVAEAPAGAWPISAAMYVTEPWDLPGGRPPAGSVEQTAQGDSAGGACDARAVLGALDALRLAGAVLYPTRTLAAYRSLSTAELRPVLARYNDWILELAAANPERLKPVVLLDVDDPEAAAAEVLRTAALGAAGAIVPLFPHSEQRYDSPRYAPLWDALEETGLPLTLHRGTCRGVGTDPRPFDLALHRLGAEDQLFDDVFDALEASYARLAVVAMTLAGVFFRHPGLSVVTVGFGFGWAPYALLRLDEQYEVRPERAGGVAAPTPSRGEEVDHGVPEHHAFASEGVGYRFDAGSRPSDHFRRHIFVASDHDDLGTELTDVLGARNMLWAPGHRIAGDGRIVIAPRTAQGAWLSIEERESVERRNAAHLYRFPLDGGRR
jgi:enoyl-CoA hydratase/carnithine racemase